MSLSLGKSALGTHRLNSWRPSTCIWLSAGLHFGSAGLLLAQPEALPWAIAALSANQVLLTLAGLLPRCQLLGPNWTRLPATARGRGNIALTFDDGPNPSTTPYILDWLDAHQCRASFFCIGDQVKNHPQVCLDIVSRGHSIENHSNTHQWDFAFSGHRGFLREIGTAQARIADVTGQPPRFFRAPFGIRNPMLEPVLAELGLQLASWTKRGYDTRERNPKNVFNRLVSDLHDGDILLLHDGNSALNKNGESVVLKVLPDLLGFLNSNHLRSISLPEALNTQ